MLMKTKRALLNCNAYCKEVYKMLNSFPVINLKATGENIVRLRKANGLKVKDIQNIFGFEQPQAVYKWQWGECLPTIDNLLVLSEIFGTTIDNILVTECDQDVSFLYSKINCWFNDNSIFECYYKFTI